MQQKKLAWCLRFGLSAAVLSSLAACGSDGELAKLAGAAPQTSPINQGDPSADAAARNDQLPSFGLDAGVAIGLPDAGGCPTFASTFDAIQGLVFERHGCTAAACHGEGKVGGLDLRAGSAFQNLVDAPSSNSANKRVQPGSPETSFLYQKLQAATQPGSVQVAGSPMPLAGNALSADELEAVRLWILKGAPKDGVISEGTTGTEVAGLLRACLPAATPIKIKPLEAPPADQGFQLRFPPFKLEAASESEHCTPFVYDFTKTVPAQYQDAARNVIYTNGSQVRLDPESHHMVVWNPKQDLSAVANETGWTCHGGAQDGQSCNPSLGSSDCQDGVCAGGSVPGTFCNGDSAGLITGVGPVTLDSFAALLELLATNGGGLPDQVASTQTPEQTTPPLPGVYTEIPLRGVFWHNLHAFNLTEQDTVVEGRVNFLYAKERKQEMRLMTDSSHVYIAAGTPPFTRKTYCATSVVPQGYAIATLASHTHRRGQRFWVTDPSGKQIYESFDYADPAYTHFAPWLTFNAPDAASRTLQYCATFNNGLTADDKPDISLVTRASRMPESTSCTPIACVAGKVTAACTTDSDCDSAPGKGDGKCDACPITGGPTTENEMFALMPWYVLPLN